MSTSLLFHTQSTTDYDFLNWSYEGETTTATIKLKKSAQQCVKCNSSNTIPSFVKVRVIQALPMGRKKCEFRLSVYRLRCLDCSAFVQEPNTLCPGPKKCYTRALAREVMTLLKAMSISDVAAHTGLHWESVKNIEKEGLAKKYKRIKLKHVTVIGIDEFYTGKKGGYITIVRDLIAGAVLFIGKGKKGECLDPFAKKLKCAKAKIRAVAVDLAASFTRWVKDNISEAAIVYDHFHVIQLMNKKLDALRRSTMNEIDQDMKAILKNKRYTLLSGQEKLKPKALADLERIKDEFEDLGIAFLMKEALRVIYATAQDAEEADIALDNWCVLASITKIDCLVKMAKTLTKKRDGILAYWTEGKLTSAAMEGFNSKIRLLMKKAYGYRDREYFHLKIFDLPTLRIVKRISA